MTRAAAADAAAVAPATRPPGTWRVAARGAKVFVPAILTYGLVQFLLILPNQTPAPTPLFLTLVAIAFVVDMVLIAVASVTASAVARGEPIVDTVRPRPARRIPFLLGWSAVWVAAIGLTAVVSAILAAIVILVGAAAMPAIVARRGWRAWFRPLRWLPVRTLVWGGAGYLLLVLNATADAEFGFLVGNPAAAAFARIVSGFINVLILCSATVLAERAQARRAARLALGDQPVAAAPAHHSTRRARQTDS